ncbi:MAG: DUF4406 domain-containing protein [Bacteroidales bacterium]|nr:DUF4406 domain-containing protein [Bacteroidales bacterium]
MKLYISGRISGLPRHIAERNFERAEKLLIANNYEPVNPMKLVPEGVDNAAAMKLLIPAMLECDGILLLDDWQWSEGAKIEESLARYCGLWRINIVEFEK